MTLLDRRLHMPTEERPTGTWATKGKTTKNMTTKVGAWKGKRTKSQLTKTLTARLTPLDRQTTLTRTTMTMTTYRTSTDRRTTKPPTSESKTKKKTTKERTATKRILRHGATTKLLSFRTLAYGAKAKRVMVKSGEALWSKRWGKTGKRMSSTTLTTATERCCEFSSSERYTRRVE